LQIPECVRAAAPDSSSQYIANRARSSAQRPQHACAMLNRRGISQRCAAQNLVVPVDDQALAPSSGAGSLRRRRARAARSPSTANRCTARARGRSGSAERVRRLQRVTPCGWYSTGGMISDCTAGSPAPRLYEGRGNRTGARSGSRSSSTE
jgi:hypothetical protein